MFCSPSHLLDKQDLYSLTLNMSNQICTGLKIRPEKDVNANWLLVTISPRKRMRRGGGKGTRAAKDTKYKP